MTVMLFTLCWVSSHQPHKPAPLRFIAPLLSERNGLRGINAAVSASEVSRRRMVGN
jgi:hypothetical protein